MQSEKSPVVKTSNPSEVRILIAVQHRLWSWGEVKVFVKPLFISADIREFSFIAEIKNPQEGCREARLRLKSLTKNLCQSSPFDLSHFHRLILSQCEGRWFDFFFFKLITHKMVYNGQRGSPGTRLSSQRPESDISRPWGERQSACTLLPATLSDEEEEHSHPAASLEIIPVARYVYLNFPTHHKTHHPFLQSLQMLYISQLKFHTPSRKHSLLVCAIVA